MATRIYFPSTGSAAVTPSDWEFTALVASNNVSDTAVYIGDSSITTTTGILLSSGSTLTIDAEKDIYTICGASGKILNIMEGK